MCDWLQSASELRMLSATPKLQLIGTLVICRLSASTATSLGCFIAFIEPVVGIPLCNLDNMYHGGIFEFFRLNYIQKRHRGVVIQQCEITCSYAATWSSPHLCVTRPCCPHRGFHSCEKNLKIFETIKVISKRVIPKFQLLRAKFEFETYIYWWNQHKNVVISGFTSEEIARDQKLYYFTLKREAFIEVNDVRIERMVVLTNPLLSFFSISFSFFSFL